MDLNVGDHLVTIKDEKPVVVTIRVKCTVNLHQNGKRPLVVVGYVCNYYNKIEEFFWPVATLKPLIDNGKVTVIPEDSPLLNEYIKEPLQPTT